MNAIIPLLTMFSVLVPAKIWYAPNQPLAVSIKSDQPLTLVMTDFAGKSIEAIGETEVQPNQTVNVKDVFPAITTPGTYVMYCVPKDRDEADFVGTPLVIESRQDDRRPPGSGPIVYKVTPLSYAVMHTDQGPITFRFYYDVAPNTVSNFLDLAQGGYYDGLTFHRIAPGFVIQGGDPLGDRNGGPGYHIDAEFNDRPHHEGVLSMARESDPNEAPGILPGPVAANSAGGQFFICLDYNSTQQLDGRYTAFGEVVEGIEVVRKIEQAPLADPASGRPQTPPVIERVEVKPVEPGHNPYQIKSDIEQSEPPATQPNPPANPQPNQ